MIWSSKVVLRVFVLFIFDSQLTKTSFSQVSSKFYQGLTNKQSYVLHDFISNFHENQSIKKSIHNNDDDILSPVDSPVIATDFGVLLGKTYPESHAFYSVPYAEPPTGRLR